MKRLIRSFGYAVSGLWYAVSTQPNFRIHCLCLVLVSLIGWYFHLPHTEWLIIVLVSGLVLAAELLNTAIEVLVDLVSPGYHEKVKV